MVKSFRPTTRGLLLSSTALGVVLAGSALDTGIKFIGDANATSVVAANGLTFGRQMSTGAVTLSGQSVTVTVVSTLSAANTVTITLPSGVTFAAAPSIATTGPLAVNIASGGSGAASAVYNVTTAGSAGSTLAFSSMSLSGLQSYIASNASATNFRLTTSITGDTVTNGSVVVLGNISDALALVTNGSTFSAQIDVPTGANRFVSGTGTALFAALGETSFTNNTSVLDASAGSLLTLSSTGGTTILTGNLTNLSTVYATTTATCATAAPSGAITATLSSTAATFAGITAGTTFTICAIASGTGILQSGIYSLRNSGTVTSGSSQTSTATTGTATYSGAVRTVNYFVGAGSYSSYAYVVNTGTASSTLLVSVRRSDGATATGALSSVAAGGSSLISAADVNTAVGSTFLVNSDTRAQVTFLLGSTNLKVTGLLVQPNGAVNQMGQQFSD